MIYHLRTGRETKSGRAIIHQRAGRELGDDEDIQKSRGQGDMSQASRKGSSSKRWTK